MSNTITCPHCGTPIPGDICQYCSKVTDGKKPERKPVRYPEVVCRYVGITFHEISFYSTLILFSFIAVICIIINTEYMEAVLLALIFSLPGIIIGITLIRRAFTFLLLSVNGTDAEGEVYGYKDDQMRYGEDFCQIAEVMVKSPEGEKILLIPLNKTSHPYPLNSSVRIRKYKDFVKITKFDSV